MQLSCFSDRVYIYIQVDTPTMVNLQTLFSQFFLCLITWFFSIWLFCIDSIWGLKNKYANIVFALGLISLFFFSFFYIKN
jgi:hypothetical protein